MKLLFLFLMVITSYSALAQMQTSCSYAITDRNGYEYEVITRYGMTRYSACLDADYDCRQALSEGQAQGRYYNAACLEKPVFPGPVPNPNPLPIHTCTTKMVDRWGYALKVFIENASTEWEACRKADNLCFNEISRSGRYDLQCLRDYQTPSPGPFPPGPFPPGPFPPGPGPLPPIPPRVITESCFVNRYDPAGYYIQSYSASHTGPVGTNVKWEACQKAERLCSLDLRGRQTCRVQN